MNELILLLSVHVLGVMSPGPDFSLVLKTTLEAGRRLGFWVAFGIALGALIHSTYCLLGLGWIIAQSQTLMTAIRWAGGLYLFYLGASALKSCWKTQGTTQESRRSEDATLQAEKGASLTTPWKTMLSGCLANLLNPKAVLFFVSIFTQIVAPSTSVQTRVFYMALIASTTFIWFALVTQMIHRMSLHPSFQRFQTGLTSVMGGVLVLLSAKLLFLS